MTMRGQRYSQRTLRRLEAYRYQLLSALTLDSCHKVTILIFKMIIVALNMSRLDSSILTKQIKLFPHANVLGLGPVSCVPVIKLPMDDPFGDPLSDILSVCHDSQVSLIDF